jgi:hypothetical protein
MSAFQDAGGPDDKKATLFISNLSRMAMVKVDGEKVIPEFHIAFEATSWFVEMLPGLHHIDAKWRGFLPKRSNWDLWPRPAILSGDFVAETGKNYYLRVVMESNGNTLFVLKGADIVELPPGYNPANREDAAKLFKPFSEVMNQCRTVGNLHLSNE